MDQIAYLLSSSGGVIARSAHRDLRSLLDSAIRSGRLLVLHPGTYCRPDDRDRWEVRILAAALWAGPDAVLTRHAAARLTFAPMIRIPLLVIALPSTVRRSAPGIRFERRVIPPDLIARHGPIAVTKPSLTAVDLADSREGGASIDEVLRTRSGTLAEMWHALAMTPGRPGNAMRRKLLCESRHEPWSEPEREAHRLLDDAGLVGWVTNARVLTYCVDVLFEAAMLVLEIDGWEVHGTRESFEADRRRRNELELAGYTVLNFTWRQLVDDPAWVIDCVLRGLGYDRCSTARPS
jgi:very-short-patch-repair endonuclease